MAILYKSTSGHVIQAFDTKQMKWLSQIFVAGDDVQVKKAFSNSNATKKEEDIILNQYLPFDMKQPSDKFQNGINKINK